MFSFEAMVLTSLGGKDELCYAGFLLSAFTLLLLFIYKPTQLIEFIVFFFSLTKSIKY